MSQTEAPPVDYSPRANFMRVVPDEFSIASATECTRAHKIWFDQSTTYRNLQVLIKRGKVVKVGIGRYRKVKM